MLRNIRKLEIDKIEYFSLDLEKFETLLEVKIFFK